MKDLIIFLIPLMIILPLMFITPLALFLVLLAPFIWGALGGIGGDDHWD